MGAVLLTPGAAIVPYSEDLLEQCDWLAERISEARGEAWVLPVTGLSSREDKLVRERQRAALQDAYGELRERARGFARRGTMPGRGRKLAALERGYLSAVARDHFGARGRSSARAEIARAVKDRA
jgi:hypothetical protein